MRVQARRRVAFVAALVMMVGAGRWLLLNASVPQVAAGTWASAGGFGPVPDGAAAATLADGRMVIAGGRYDNGTLVSQIGIFDPASQSWDNGGQLVMARTGHTASALSDGRVLFAGGTTANGVTSDVEIYDPRTGQSVHSGFMWSPRVNHASASLGSVVFIAGGSDGFSKLDHVELFDADTGQTESLAVRMSAPREKLTATTLLDGHVLLAGGRNDSGDLAIAEIFESGSRSIFPTGPLHAPRSGHVAVLLPNNNQVLIAGGNGASAELYADWRNGFSVVPNAMAEARTGALGGALPLHALAFVGGGGPATGEYFGYATVKTDKDDYAPGENVTITGSGWQPGERVALKISEDADTHYDFNYEATADAGGNIINQEFAPIENETFHHIGMRFYLVASGAASSALNTFTDAQKLTGVYLGAQTPNPVIQGSSATYGVSATTDNSNSNSAVDVAVSIVAGTTPIPAGVSVTPTSLGIGRPSQASEARCVPGRGVPSGNKCYDSFDVSIATTASTPAGTYGLKLKLDAQGTDTAERSFTLVVESAIRPTSTSVSCGPNPIAVNGSTTCTATVSDTGTGTPTVPAGSVAFVSSGAGSFDAASCTLAGSPATCAVIYTPTARGTGTHAITGSYSATSSHSNSSNGSAPFNLTVNKASQAELTLTTPASLIYGGTGTASVSGGSGTGAVTFTAGSSTGCSVNATSGDISVTNAAGTCAISADKAADDDYLVASAGPKTVTLEKADATVTVTGYSGTYDAGAHGATGSATGVGGADLSAQLNLGASFTDFPGGVANWTFNGGNNYLSESGSVNVVINKADATVNVTGYTGTYDGAAHGASGTAIGVGGVALAGLNLGATFTDVPGGTVNWTFSGGINYLDESGSVGIVINKADATVNVTGYTGTYDGAAHGASGTATGVGGANLSGQLNLGAGFTDAPGGMAHWTFSGGTNYLDESGDVGVVINKADATVNVTGYTGTYDGAAHGATGTATGVGGANLSAQLNLGATFTGVPGGTAHWTFSGGTNYLDESGDVDIVINKADATVNVTGYTGTYDGAAHGASGTATGVGGVALPGLNLGATFTDVPGGTAHWTFSGGTNYADESGDIEIVVNKADATVNVTGYTGTYDGAAHGATGTATGVGGVALPGLNLGATFTDVPGGTAHWTFSGGTNYLDESGDVGIVINKANATIVVTPYDVMYDGAAHTATASATGVAGVNLVSLLNLSGTTHTLGGYYPTDTWTFAGNGNYAAANGTVSDRVRYAWSDLRQPINVDGSSVFKLGSTIPVKFQLTGASASISNLVAHIYVAKVSNGVAGTEVEPATNVNADAGNVFRYDASANQYIFNWGTKGLTEGTWQIRIDLGDGETHVVNVSLRK